MRPIDRAAARALVAAVAVGSAVLAAPGVAVEPAPSKSWRATGASRVVAVSDVHGAHTALVEVLRQSGVIDEAGRWSAGTTHLVACGDLVDRGGRSREVLDLVMRLQQEARAAGGRLHVLLGNHEAMNLVGDLRYVTPEDFAAYRDEEDPAARKAAFGRHVSAAPSAITGRPRRSPEAEFDARHPPGYFGHRAAFAPEGRYGRWLLELPAIVVIDDVAFAHGGFPPAVAELGAEEVNRRVGAELREYLDLRARAVTAGAFTPEADYETQLRWVAAVEEGRIDAAPELREVARRMDELASHGLALSERGPLWYRGSASGPEPAEAPVLEAALERLSATRAVIGHTPQLDGRVHVRFDGRLFLIDTVMQGAPAEGAAAAWVLAEGRPSVVYAVNAGAAAAGERGADPAARAAKIAAAERRRTAAAGMTDQELEAFLSGAEVVDREEIGTGVTNPWRLTLRDANGVELRAVFKYVDGYTEAISGTSSLQVLNKSDRYVYDVAAYRLDRLLGLGLVPVAVLRTVEGKRGAVQLWVERVFDDEQRGKRDQSPPDRAAFDGQWRIMQVFDALIYNEDRNQGNILYGEDDWRVHLIDHTRAFRTYTTLPPALRDVELEPPPDLARAIAALDKEKLRDALAGLVNPLQIQALLARAKKLGE